MQEIHERVLVLSEVACRSGSDSLAVVHACKSPCHQRGVGYTGNLQKTHPNYLTLTRGNDLFLNIIDPPIPLFPDELFAVFLSFAREKWDAGLQLLIHCNKGESRAPSLGLVFLAKHIRALPNGSYAEAKREFVKRFPNYTPGKGIETYLTNKWQALDAY
jgi:predicted protein tyrosine phosphatase